MRYAIIIEKGPKNYGAYVPDLPGCITVGDTVEEVYRMMQEALEGHIETMILHGETVPEPTSEAGYVDVDMARVEANVTAERQSKA